MSQKEIQSEAREAPLRLVRLSQEAQRKYYVANLPWWRHPLIGYLTCVPLTALTLAIPFAMRHLVVQDYFLGAPLFVTIVIIALIWGAGPAILSIIIGTSILDYFFVLPYNEFDFKGMQEVLPLIPFLVAELIIALITAQLESARRRAFIAEQDILLHAEELEQTNKRLEDANRLKTHFISMASHELKTPITSIRGQAQIAIRKLKKQQPPSPELETVCTSLEKIDTQTHRLQNLVDDLLDMSVLQSGKINLRLKQCNLTALCEEIVSDQRLLSNREIELRVPEKGLILRADEERVGQVITNLVTNAVKYSPPETPIRVLLTKQTDRTLIAVHNEGDAIPKNQQMRLFELFYRASNAQNSSKEGWGLGLAISKDIVERHGGRVWVQSVDGEGTTFFVELPLSSTN
jgi:signal transduction histidine kinase